MKDGVNIEDIRYYWSSPTQDLLRLTRRIYLKRGGGEKKEGKEIMGL